MTHSTQTNIIWHQWKHGLEWKILILTALSLEAYLVNCHWGLKNHEEVCMTTKLCVLLVKDIHQQLFPLLFLLLCWQVSHKSWWWDSVMGWHGWAGCSQLRWAWGWRQRRRRRAQDRTPGLQPSQPGTNPHHTAILGNPGTQTLELVLDI